MTMASSIEVSEDTLAFEILNRHCEYHDGLSRGQRFVGADNALAAVREALAMKAVEQPLVLDEVERACAIVSEIADEYDRISERHCDAQRPLAETLREQSNAFRTLIRAALVGIPVDDVREIMQRSRNALQRMMDTWLDYHDANSLTQPVTGASNNAFEDALAARDELDAAISAIEGLGAIGNGEKI